MNVAAVAPWLVIAYLGWLVLMAVGVAVNRTFAISLDVLLQRTPDGPLSSEIAQLFLEPRVRAATVITQVRVIGVEVNDACRYVRPRLSAVTEINSG